MSVSKTGVLLFTIMFYIIISLFIGMSVDDVAGMELVDPDKESALIPATSNTGDFDLGGNVGKKANFLMDIVKGYQNMPDIVNTIVFAPLAIILTWLIVTTFIPTVDGGS